MAMIQPSTFGALLKRYRVAAGLTQEELAERAQLSVRGISDLERGVHRAPYRDTLQRLANALRLSSDVRARLEGAMRGFAVDSVSGTPLYPSVVGRAAASSHPSFVGRGRELALLEHHLAGDEHPLLLVAGEPGIGKSRLLQETAHCALGRGLTVLQGGCQRHSGEEPYAPLPEALTRHIRSLSAAKVRGALQGCRWLVRVVPELMEIADAPLPLGVLAAQQERRLVFGAVIRFLTNVAGPEGALLILDDLQWAGGDALDLLATLARSAAGVPLRIVGAYRDTEVTPQDRLSVVLADLAHAGLARRLPLAPLARDKATELLHNLLADAEHDPGLTERILERSEGVPFFLVSCAQALQMGALDEHRAGNVPWDVTQGIQQRLAALPEAAQDVLGTAAVVGRAVPRHLLVAATSRSEEAVAAGLTSACRARLLVEEGEHAYQFAHDVIREVVEADLGAAQRAVLHRRVAEALERVLEELPLELLAYHYGRSGQQDKAIVYLEQAGDKARTQHAHAAAEGYYRELLERLQALGRGTESARVREKLAAVLITVASYDEALMVLDPAVKSYQESGDLEAVARVIGKIGRVHRWRGAAEEGIAHVQEVLASLDQTEPSQALATLYLALTELFFAGSRHAESLAAAEAAAEVARKLRDAASLAEAELTRGTAIWKLGDTEQGRRVLEQAVRLSKGAGDYNTLGRCLINLGLLFWFAGDFERGRTYAQRAVEAGEQTGNVYTLAFGKGALAWALLRLGDWKAARLYGEEAVDLDRSAGRSWHSAASLIRLGHVCLAEGQWEEAAQLLEEAVAIADHDRNPMHVRMAQWPLAELDLLAGRPSKARARLEPLVEGAEVPEHEGLLLLSVLAWACLEEGHVARAEALAEAGIRRATAGGHRHAQVELQRVRGMVRARQSRWDEAELDFDEALALARSLPYPYAEARTLYQLGLMATRRVPGFQGALEEGRARLEGGLAIFRRLGAAKDIERTELVLESAQNAGRAVGEDGHALDY
jgi:predicted ATPase/transcriptional regulator with XRE-family HTH domain